VASQETDYQNIVLGDCSCTALNLIWDTMTNFRQQHMHVLTSSNGGWKRETLLTREKERVQSRCNKIAIGCLKR